MGYRDPEFESLPEGWSVSVLKDVVEIHNTKREPLNSQDRVGRKGEYPYCGANGVVDHIDDYKYDGEYVLIAEDGGYWGKHEPSSYIMRGKFWVNNHAHVVRAKDGVTTNKFFSLIINYLNIDPFIGGDARGKLTKAVLQDLEIPHPEFHEQQRIAQVLSTVQQAIEQQERLIRTTTELKQALMQKLFTEGLRGEAQKESEIGLVPESWEVVTLQSVCELVIDCPHTTPNFLSEGVRVARNFNIRDGRFVSEPASYTSEEQYLDRVRRAVPKPGDVLFSREAPVGEACVIPEGMRLSLGQRTMLLRTDRKRLNPDFLVYSFYSPVLSKHMKSIASGLTVAHLNVSDVRSMPLPLPALDVQNEITVALLAIERMGEQHRTKLATLQGLFRTLLHELMTGKVRVGESKPGLN